MCSALGLLRAQPIVLQDQDSGMWVKGDLPLAHFYLAWLKRIPRVLWNHYPLLCSLPFRCCAAPDWPKAPHRVPQGPFLPSVAVHWRTPPLTQWTWAAVPKDPQWHVRTPTGRAQTSCSDCRKQAQQAAAQSHVSPNRTGCLTLISSLLQSSMGTGSC